jgi:hypothetical protein
VPTMLQSPEPDQTHPDPGEVVLGVDTHKDVHVAAVISTLGALLGTCPFPTTGSGYSRYSAGPEGLERFAAQAWSALAPTGQRWPVTSPPSRLR